MNLNFELLHFARMEIHRCFTKKKYMPGLFSYARFFYHCLYADVFHKIISTARCYSFDIQNPPKCVLLVLRKNFENRRAMYRFLILAAQILFI